MQREFTPPRGEKKVVLRQTPRAVTPFGTLRVFIEFLQKIGFGKQVSGRLPVRAIDARRMGFMVDRIHREIEPTLRPTRVSALDCFTQRV